MTLTASEVKGIKEAPRVDGVLPVFHTRWSPRSFADREVTQADLEKVFEAARWAASSNNAQPWRFLAGVRGTETHAKLAKVLAGFNQTWAPKAPVLILGLAQKRFSKGGAENGYALYDLGAASAYLTLQASALGLGTHQMGGYDREGARKAFGITEDYALGAMIALGHQGEPARLGDETLIARETTARTRMGLGEIVFTEWVNS